MDGITTIHRTGEVVDLDIEAGSWVEMDCGCKYTMTTDTHEFIYSNCLIHKNDYHIRHHALSGL